MDTRSARLVTARCVLRAIDPEADAAALYELNLDPEVLRWTGDEPFASVEETRAFYEKYVAEVYPGGFGRWSVLDRESGAFLGWCGLKQLDRGIDLGFRFARRYWGKGLATETGRASMEWGFRERGLDRIIAEVQAGNAASIRVLEKLGFAKYGETTFAGAPWLLHEVFAKRAG